MKIIYIWNKLLRKKSENIENFSTKELSNLIDFLKEELKKSNGVGIAAPQFGLNKNIFIIHSFPNKRYPYAPEFGPIEIINPEILETCDEMETWWEGCLSIPWKRWLVKRYKKIKVRYFDKNGKEYVKYFEWFIARIFQHEYDHLQWILFVDKVDKIYTEEEFLKMID